MQFDPVRVQQQLAEILTSSQFNRSERLCRFLRFAVAAALAGDNSRVKEYVIGVEVFDRGADFDPRVDPVVRVEARRLRSRLKSWYQNEGRDAEIVIDLPTGAYAASISLRSQSTNVLPCEPEAKSIAVLPFSNLNGDPEMEYLSDGLTEELIHALTRMSNLHVFSWHSVARLKGNDRDIGAIRERLRVEHVLRGSVRRSGDRLRVTAQLIDTASEHYIWSEAWDRSAGDLLAIEQEIAGAIVDKLKPERTQNAGREQTAAPRSVDPAVHAMFLKGRFQLNKRTPDGLRLAWKYLKEAVERAPDWPLGWAGLADACILLSSYGVQPGTVGMRDGMQAAERALELDPNCAEALTCLACVKAGLEWAWEEARRLYERAIQLNPGYPNAHHWYADMLFLDGRVEEALRESDTAIALDPLSSIVLDTKAFFLMMAGRFEEAEACLLDLLQHESFFTKSRGALGRLYVQMNRLDEAIGVLEGAVAIGGNNPKVLGALGQAYGYAGRHAKARSVLSTLNDLSRTQYVGPSSLALVHLGLGETGLALECLQRATEEREMSVTWLGVHPAWNPLREDARFKALLGRLRLRDISYGKRLP